MGWPFAHPVVVIVEVPQRLMLGFSLNPFAGVVPSGVEASTVDAVHVGGVVTVTPVHVSRTYTSCVGPTPGIKFCAVEAKATKRPSCEIEGSAFVPPAGVTPSGVDTIFVTGAQVLPAMPIVVTQVVRSKISFAPARLEPGTRFAAADTKETKRPRFAMAGCELEPSPAVVPSGETETRYVVGT